MQVLPELCFACHVFVVFSTVVHCPENNFLRFPVGWKMRLHVTFRHKYETVFVAFILLLLHLQRLPHVRRVLGSAENSASRHIDMRIHFFRHAPTWWHDQTNTTHHSRASLPKGLQQPAWPHPSRTYYACTSVTSIFLSHRSCFPISIDLFIRGGG